MLIGLLSAVSSVIVLDVAPAGAQTAPSRTLGVGSAYCTSYAAPGHDVKGMFSFDNVYACGPDFTKGNTPFDENGGASFQCEDLSIRFLWSIYGVWAGPGIASGSKYYGAGGYLVDLVHTAIDSKIPVGTPRPGSVPSAGNIISFLNGVTDGTIGHTAVVISSSTSSGRFETMSQNFPEGTAGEQVWQVDLTGKHNGKVEFLGTPSHVVATGLWSNSNWLAPTTSYQSDVSSRVAIGVNANGSLQLFMVGMDGAIETRWLSANGSWSGSWVSLGGSFPTNDAIGVITNVSGKLQIFAVSKTGQMLTNFEMGANTYTTWHPWSADGPAGQFPPGLNAITGASNQSGVPQVFAIGDGARLETSYLSSTGWTTWKSLGGPAARSIAQLSAVLNTSGRLQVFEVTDAGEIFAALEDGANTPGAWLALNHLVGSDPVFPLAAGTAVVPSANGKPQEFEVGSGGEMESTDLTTGWSPFFSVGGSLYPSSHVGAGLSSKGEINVFALSSGGHLMLATQKAMNVPTSFSSWTSFDGASAPDGDWITVDADASGALHVFFLGNGGALATAVQTSAATWGGLRFLGGDWPSQ